jgi:hypothetical protein
MALAAGVDMSLVSQEASFSPAAAATGRAAAPLAQVAPSAVQLAGFGGEAPIGTTAAASPAPVARALPTMDVVSAAPWTALEVSAAASGALRAASLAPALTFLSGGVTPRGIFLMPQAAAEAIALRRGESQPAVAPLEMAALDVLAAGAVAGSGAGQTVAVDVARAMFEGDLVLPSWAEPPPSYTTPAVRAARALAAAAGGAAAQTLPVGPATQTPAHTPIDASQATAPDMPAAAPRVLSRAAAAPIPTYAAPDDRAARSRAPFAGAALAAASAAPAASSASPAARVEGGDRALRAAGESLRSIIAPSMVPSIATTEPTLSARAASAPSTEMVRTGDTSPAGLPSPAQTAGAPSDFKLPEWFEELAKKMMSSAGAPDGPLGLPELTLVTALTAVPGQRLAAAERRIAASPPASAPKGGTDKKGGALKDEDIDQLARDIYDEIRRMFEVERERSGDLWRS